MLYEEKDYKINPDSSVYIYIRRIVQVFNDEGIWQEGTPQIHYFRDNEQIRLLFARSVQPDGTVKSVTSSAIELSSVYGWLPNYDRLGRLKFALGGLTKGTIIDWACEIKKDKINALEPFAKKVQFSEKGEVREKIVRISLPTGWKLYTHCENGKRIKFNQYETGSRIEYIFYAKDIPPIKIENLQPPYIYIGSTLFFSTEESNVKFASEVEKIFNDEQGKVKEKLTGIVDSLKDEVGDDPLIIAKRLYNYMINSFRIVHILPTQFRFYPVNLLSNLESGVLSLFDAHFCYWDILNLAGIPSSFLLVRSGDDGFLPTNLFSPYLYDFPIVRVELPDTSYYVYLASTDYPFGLIPSSLKGKPFLALPYENRGSIANQSKEEYLVDKKMVGTFIHPDTLALHITISSYNQAIPSARSSCKISRQELKNSYIVSLSHTFRSFELDSFSLVGCEAGSSPTTELFIRVFEPLVEGNESLWAFPLPGLPEPENYAGADKRTNPIYIANSVKNQIEFKLKLPSSLVPIGIPEPIKFNKPPFSYSFIVSYDSVENLLRVQVTDIKSNGLYPSKDYKKLKKYLQSKADAKRKWVILKGSGDF